jgi:hypothetical protein
MTYPDIVRLLARWTSVVRGMQEEAEREDQSTPVKPIGGLGQAAGRPGCSVRNKTT